MILRDLYVDLDRDRYATDDAYPFKLRSRAVCNFIGRCVWKRQIRVPGFNRVVINVAIGGPTSGSVLSTGVASIHIPIDQVPTRLSGPALHEFYVDCILRSRVFLEAYSGVVPTIEEAIGLFRAGGYRNVWTAASRTDRVRHLKAELFCDLDPQRFSLRLVVSRAGSRLADREVFVSDPDEVCFHSKFRDIAFETDSIVVVPRIGSAVIRIPYSAIEESANKSPETNALK